MKSSLCSSFSKAALLIVLMTLSGTIVMNAEGNDPLHIGVVRPSGLDYRTESAQGYLKVYAVTDEFNDGAYYAHSSFAIYSADGKLFKRVENNISRTDEIIPWEMALPAGSYTVVARLVRGGEVRVHVVISTGRRTILDLDQEQEVPRRRLARVMHSQRLADQ